MDIRKTTLERAFELAQSGECADVNDLRRRLTAEHYTVRELTGPQLIKQLRLIIKQASSGGDKG